MLTKVGADKFLDLSLELPVIDVRSPGEYENGHIPGAYNIPLFDDMERSVVGKKYKQVNRKAAIFAGLEFVGPKITSFVKQARKIARKDKILVHCWRGGMRSETIAWLFRVAGLKPYVLTGGYQAYRKYIREKLSAKQKMFILGGMTGCGKTEILYEMEKQGQQVIDLECFANHKGSAFGALGQKNQPSTEQFTNNLFDAWKSLDADKTVWIEDESKNIGSVTIPDELYEKISKAPVVVVEMGKKLRIKRLVKEYSLFDPQYLEQSIMKIQKRLGGLNTQNCIKAVREKKFAKAIDISLTYYDKAYRFGLEKKKKRIVGSYMAKDEAIHVTTRNIIDIAKKDLKLPDSGL